MRQQQSVARATGAGSVSADLSDDDIVSRVRSGCTDAFELLI